MHEKRISGAPLFFYSERHLYFSILLFLLLCVAPAIGRRLFRHCKRPLLHSGKRQRRI